MITVQIKVKAGAVGGIDRLKRRAIGGLKAGIGVLEEQVKANLNGPPHTAQQLAAMDHPYATRHGSIQASDPNEVGRNTGSLYSSVKTRPEGEGQALYFDESVAPHARAILQGTGTMLPRDPVGPVVSLPANQEAILSAIVEAV